MAGVGVVAVTGESVLLVRRRYAPLAGYWSVPGGLIELGETAAAAAARELREETGLRARPRELLAAVDRIVRDGRGRVEYHYLILDFWVRMARPLAPRAGSDAAEARWVEWGELGRLRLTPGLRRVLNKARCYPE